MSKLKVALIGAGNRGNYVFGDYAISHPENIEFIAVAEPNKIKREEFARKHNIELEFQFDSWEPLLEKDKFCDAIIIATPDEIHFEPAKLALLRDYHVLLEKPMANDPQEIMELGHLAKNNNNVFMICHILRYSPLFSTVKNIIDSGDIGELVSIQYNENVAYYHFGHAFVRGNWRNSDLSSPLMLQKSCHDMDILLWLVGSDCTKIASFGKLSYFNKDNKPSNAAERCVSCERESECEYSAPKLYYDNVGNWPTTAVCETQTLEEIKTAVKEGPYGRCVYSCDNNVVDHQSTILEFENGVTATFNVCAFTNKGGRTFKIMGTKGEIRAIGIKNEIEVQIFGNNEIKLINPKVSLQGHGDGDIGMMNDFISLILFNKGEALTDASISVQSHMMALAADESRENSKVVDMKEYCDKYLYISKDKR